LPIYRALTPNPEERMIREFVLQMKLGHVESAYFQRKFGVDVERRFEQPLQNLKDRGFLATDHGTLLLNRDGLLQVDRLLHDFFLPQHRTARYA
jgi:oxygen-independent coproporphyrinogen-3 oxidase